MKNLEQILKEQVDLNAEIDKIESKIREDIKIKDQKDIEHRKFINEEEELQEKVLNKENSISKKQKNIKKLSSEEENLKQELEEKLDYENLEKAINNLENSAEKVIDKALEKTRVTNTYRKIANQAKQEIIDTVGGIKEELDHNNFLSEDTKGFIEIVNNLVTKYKDDAPVKAGIAYHKYGQDREIINNIFDLDKNLKSIPKEKKKDTNQIKQYKSDIEELKEELKELEDDYKNIQTQNKKIYKKADKNLKEAQETNNSLLEEHQKQDQEVEKSLKMINQYNKRSREMLNIGNKIEYLTSENRDSGYSLEIHQMDVGQGESALIICKNNQQIEWSILLDAGENVNNNSEHIKNYIEQHIGKNNKINAVIVTHDDKDHHGDILSTIKNADSRDDDIVYSKIYEVLDLDNIIVVTQDYVLYEDKSANYKNEVQGSILGKNIWELLSITKPNGTFPNMTCIAHGGKVKGRKGDKYLADFLSNDQEKSKNDRSLGFLIEFGGFKFYTAGDLSSQIEDQINIGKVSAFKAGHHGSKYSTSASLISSLQPRAAVISHGGKVFSDEAHPNDIALGNIDENENIQFAYMTNPISKNMEKDIVKAEFVNKNDKFVVAGRNKLLHSKNKEKNPRGDVCFRVTKQQADLENVFFVEYKRNYEGSKNQRKDRIIIDDFTNVEPQKLEKITLDGLETGKNITVDSSSRMQIVDIEVENKVVKGNLRTNFSSVPEMHGYYRSRGEEYQTDNPKHPKTKVSKKDRVVLKLSKSLEENREFFKSLNPQGYDELMKNIPEYERDQIELYKGQTNSKIKVKAGNDGESSVSLSWIEKIDDKNVKNKLKIKSLNNPEGSEDQRFVDRISFTKSNKTKGNIVR